MHVMNIIVAVLLYGVILSLLCGAVVLWIRDRRD